MTKLLPGRSKRSSLTARLAWRLAAVMLCTILLAAAAVAWRSYVALQDIDDAGLAAQADFLIRHLPSNSSSDNTITVPMMVVDRFRASDGDTVFLIFGHNNQLLATSDAAQAATFTPLLPDPLPLDAFRLPALPGHPQGMMALARHVRGLLVLVIQGRDETEAVVDSLTAHFVGAALDLLLPIGLVMLLVSILTIRLGLRRLTRVSEEAAAIGPSEPGRRLSTENLPSEVMPLVETVNQALARLERTIAVQRSFMAQAAHGLRTPLAVLTARLDNMPDTPESAGLRHDTDRMSRLVAQLLRMARLASLPLDVTEPVDLRDVVAEAISGLAPLAIRQGIELELAGASDIQVCGNRAAILLALTNLIENAVGYGPRGTVVEVAIAPPADITVRDRGVGIAAEDEARLLRPFERGSRAPEGGAGLGLAIVEQIASAHGGRLRLTNRSGGGAEARLTLNSALRPQQGSSDLPAAAPGCL